MAHPVYILAGQSNARAMRDSIKRSLDIKHGENGYTLVTVSASGAPLTYKRAEADWAAPDELGETLVTETLAALASEEGGEIAGLIWIQGEADTYAIARSDEYQTALSSLIDDWREAVFTARENSGADSARISIAQLSTHASGGNGRDNWSGVAAQQMAYGAGDGRVDTINPDLVAAIKGIAPQDMFSDGLHYSALFQPAFAEALIQALSAPGAGPGTGTALDDTLLGTPGADILTGGAGNDTYIFNDADDRIVEWDGQGRDSIIALRHLDLSNVSAHVEDALLAGDRAHRLTGNALDNHLTGNGGDNRLEGGEGVDTLSGAGGDDRLIDHLGGDLLIGGAGDDRYRLHASGSRIEEDREGGHDHVIASVDFTLRFHSQYIEDLTLTGQLDLNGTGNGLDNRLTGNRGDNRLDGAWGDDLLQGRAGADVLIGHRGDDVLIGGRGGDVFVFRADHGPGHDRILDFDPARDRLDLDGGIRSLGVALKHSPDGVLIGWSAQNSVLLSGVGLDDLAPEWIATL